MTGSTGTAARENGDAWRCGGLATATTGDGGTRGEYAYGDAVDLGPSGAVAGVVGGTVRGGTCSSGVTGSRGLGGGGGSVVGGLGEPLAAEAVVVGDRARGDVCPGVAASFDAVASA